MKLIWIATSISVKCHGWLLTKKERCGVRNGKIKLYYWTKITIAFNRNGGDNGRFFALFLPKLSICHFSLHSFSIDFKFQSCVCARFFLLLNVLWNKTLSFFHYCLACFPFNSSVDFIFFFLIVVVVALDDDNRKKLKWHVEMVEWAWEIKVERKIEEQITRFECLWDVLIGTQWANNDKTLWSLH